MNTEFNAEKSLDELLTIAKDKFSAERFEKLSKFYSDFKEQILIAPASGVVSYHNAWPGGYLAHIHNVIRNSYSCASLLKKNGGVVDFSEEEMVFAAMHHDLGKLGDGQFPYYVPNDSDWHIEHRGEFYKNHPDIQYMRVTERAIYLLQLYEVKMTRKEFLAIRLSDGIYDESNKPYYLTLHGYRSMRTNLFHVIHWADHISCVAERDQYKKDQNVYDYTPRRQPQSESNTDTNSGNV